MAEIDVILNLAEQRDASDVHLKAGLRPRLRVSGELVELAELAPLEPADVSRLTREVMTDEQRSTFERGFEIDFTYGSEHGRFRFACYRDQQGPGAALRRIPQRIATLPELGLPDTIAQFAHLRRGLVLVTGATGSGKSSTLAAILDVLNETYQRHVITLEDPIEYLHEDKLAVVHQLAMHDDFPDFGTGIAQAMRQDPDVLVIGELRDLDSMSRALTAAETGILVFSTLHTNSAAESVDRIIDAFPSQEQAQARVQLSESLAGVVSQTLIPRRDKTGRVPATEVLVATRAVASIIREGKTQDLANVIQGGRARGMHTLDESLQDLVRRKVIDGKEAQLHARNAGRFAQPGAV